ncbi:MAG TPA: hypothetical protein VJT15_05195 [Pyrinomonadaceae bacterium]|nr:hypothetical protein [Pyrinomonadaceae bacterium]
MRSRKGRFILISAWVSWALVTVLGVGVLWSYENAPGTGATAPSRWPVDSSIRPAAERATLVMLAHPHCPCTRASIGELDRLMAQAQGRLTAYVLFLKPAGSPDDWEKSDLWQSAARIPDVNVVLDDDGVESRRFHAMTSGQTVVYDNAGRLLFSGGITRSRGHSGDNEGRSAIVSLLNAGEADRAETAVFGCPLYQTGSECREEEHDGHVH